MSSLWQDAMWSLAVPDVVEGKPVVLVVTADAGRRAELARVLAAHGFEPLLPPTRQSALSRLRYVDLVLLELGHGDAEGWELCRVIRRRSSSLPIVIVTVGAGEGLVDSVFAAGGDDHVEWPLRERDFIARLRTRIRKSTQEKRTVVAAERYGQLIRGAAVPLFVLENGWFAFASRSLGTLLGVSEKGIVGTRTLHDLVVEEDRAAISRCLQRWMLGRDESLRSRARFICGDGEIRELEICLRGVPGEQAGVSVGTLIERVPVAAGLVQPEGQGAEGSIQIARSLSGGMTPPPEDRREPSPVSLEALFHGLVEGNREVFFYVRDREGGFVYLSPAVQEILGEDPAALVGTSPEWLRESEPEGEVGEAGARLVHATHRDGARVVLELVEGAVEGDGARLHGFARDVSSREEAQSSLRDAAFRDGLTGLPNRALFTDRVNQALARSKRNPDCDFALLFLDLDRFKEVNDNLGHVVGDHLLMAVAQRLRGHLRPEDTLARLGGDEFAILLQDLPDRTHGTRVAQRIGEYLSVPFQVGGFEVGTSASIGIVHGSPAAATPEALLRNADMAMYRAKAAGGGSFALYDHAMHADAMRRLLLESQLREAVDRDELRLFFQPIIDMTDGSVAGAEALIRWEHPYQGLLVPEGFIGIAEETGFITSMGSWILSAASSFLAEWQRKHDRKDLFLSINLSSRQLLDPALVPELRSALRRTGIAPENLRLEITEKILIDGAERAAHTLRELRNLGIRTYLDDFGTGYGALSFLHTLPLYGLKLDRSLIGRMDSDPRAVLLIDSTLSLAQGLGLSVIAEGVEQADQAELLARRGCHYAQGFFYSRPMPASDFLNRLSAAA